MSTFRTSDCSNRCSECAPGFTGLDALREKARYIPNLAKVGGGEVGGWLLPVDVCSLWSRVILGSAYA